MRQKLKVALFCSLSLLGGCNALHVYTIDLPQGNPVTRETASRLKTGMTPAQVRYILGTPMVDDPLTTDRWDYVYTFQPGTYARQAGLKPVTNQHLVVRFTNGKVSAIEGLETLPEKSQGALPSRDRGLNAEPL
ncbi:Beta-barrel assembly machine subunit BamE [Fluviicoccus keumensis]|uniref:Outer membrane protein assembly factor BamE n=1 Tax=Fluviicoccus keumensis TaxID=1435465 RepID=A0A4Q7ZAT7_9GAMM|nr:outer membrane protein assembly factor BamE [Fluviicoccus keumensis]RZU47712.1 Beta-barrel assembly machine subunit BamE [Fluviicoccus keumensis]